MIDQLTEHDRTELRVPTPPARAARHNEGGFRMAWGKLRRLALVSSASHSHRGRHQGLLNERGVGPALESNLPGARPHFIRRFSRTAVAICVTGAAGHRPCLEHLNKT